MVTLMSAVVLAAGVGARMGNLSRLCPKPLIPVAGRPLIDWVIQSLLKAGVKRFIVVVGHMGGIVERHVMDRWRSLNVDCIHADNYFKGAGHSLLAAENHVSGEFILCPADLVFDHEVALGLMKGAKKLRVPVIATGSAVKGGTPVSTSGGRCGEVLGIGEGGGSGRVCVGLVALDSSFFTHLRRSLARGEGSVVSALKLYVEEGNMLGFVDFPGRMWFDVDTPSDVLDANRHALRAGLVPEEGVYVPPGEIQRDVGAFARGSTLVGPILLGLGGRVECSTLGPDASLSGSVSCRNAVVSDAVVFGGGRITGVAREAIVFGGIPFPARGAGVEQV
ncbi:MAG: NTP transferase domain-containing protein [Candidatus Freyarchaeota archaeon]|nr:NTP transferase domain-containing protein [Candidatus Jordarchaeia archaeon]